MNNEEFRNAIRQMLDHENDLVNSRYTWMLTIQALLFAALGVFWGKDTIVELSICGVGFCTTASVWYSLYLANRAIWNLVDDWKSYCDENPTAFNLPGIYGLKREWPQWALPWLFVPPILLLTWIIIVLRVWHVT